MGTTTRSPARPASTRLALDVKSRGRTVVKMERRWGTGLQPAKMGMCKKAGIVGESVVNGPVTRSLRMPSSTVPRTTSRMGTSYPATCVLRRAAMADQEEPSCARRTPPGTKAHCGVLSSECLEQLPSLVLNVLKALIVRNVPSFEFSVVLHCHQLPQNK